MHTKLVDRQHIRMIETGDCSRFADKALHPLRISRDFGRQKFESNCAIQLARVLGEVHLAHPTRTDVRPDFVTAEFDAFRQWQSRVIILIGIRQAR